MRLPRLISLALFSVVATSANAAAGEEARGVLSPAQKAACPGLTVDFARTDRVLTLYRAYTGPDGESRIEKTTLPGQGGVYYGGKVSLTQFGLGDPSNAVIVYGHPNMAIPPHPSPYREIFLIVSGSSTVQLVDGTRYELTPGSMLLSEDQDSRTGRGGTSGPCGYVAIDFQYKTPAAKTAP